MNEDIMYVVSVMHPRDTKVGFTMSEQLSYEDTQVVLDRVLDAIDKGVCFELNGTWVNPLQVITVRVMKWAPDDEDRTRDKNIGNTGGYYL